MASKSRNDIVKVEDRRSPEAEDYMPEKDSALFAAFIQARGDTHDERDKTDVKKHTHDGTNSEKLHIRDFTGFIATVDAVPTHEPKGFYDQFKMYVNGATLRLYMYDYTNGTWRYATLT